MKQHVQVILPVIFLAVLTVSPMTTICMGYSMYDLGVKEGDWVEYKVVEARNWELFQAEIHPDDRIRFEVVVINKMNKMYPNGTVAFEFEVPICDVFLNGECIQRNVEFQWISFPKGEEHWRDLEKIEETWEKLAPEYGVKYESDITIGQDTVLFSYQMENTVNGGTNITIHRDTGVTLEFERYLDVGEKRTEFLILISDTSVSGILAPWYVTYRYFIVLLVVVVTIAFAMLLKYQQIKKKGGKKMEKDKLRKFMQLNHLDKISIKPDIKKVKIIVFITTILLIMSVNLLYAIVWKEGFFEITIGAVILFFALLFIGSLLHELVHIIGFLLFTDAKFSDIKIGLKYFSPFVYCKKVVKINGFRLAIIMPIFLTGIIPIIIGVLTNSLMIANIGCLLTAGGIGDVIGFIYMLKVPNNALVYDYEDEMGSEVYLPKN